MDFDADGDTEVLSGSWPGELYFFERNEEGKFEDSVQIMDKDNNPINVGKAATVFAVDWDGDKDLDLLVGDIAGRVQLIRNQGTSKESKFVKAETIDLGSSVGSGGDSGPVAADWDADGKLDLVVPFGDGSVYWYRNEGDADETKLAEGKQLVGPSEFGFDFEKYEPGMWGARVKICVIDWNNDGQLDLLVGDRGGKIIDLSSEKKKELEDQKAAITKKSQELSTEFRKEINSLKSAIKEDPKNKELKAQLAEKTSESKKSSQEMTAKLKSVSTELKPERVRHGFIHVFLRKSDDKIAAVQKE